MAIFEMLEAQARTEQLRRLIHALLYGTSEHEPMHEVYLEKLRKLVPEHSK